MSIKYISRCVSIHDSEGGLVRIFKGESSLCNGNIGGGTRSSNSEEDLKLQTPYFVAIDKSNGNIIVSDWASNDVKVVLIVFSQVIEKKCFFFNSKNML